MRPTRAFTAPYRAFRAPRSPCPRPSDHRPSSPPHRMAPEKIADGFPRNGGFPRIRDGVCDAKASACHHSESSPWVANKSGKEHLQKVVGAGDSPSSAELTRNVGSSELCESGPFDICMPQRVDHVKLKLSLFEQNRAKRKEIKQAKMSPQHQILQPGMILLKNYLAHNDQVEIIRQCQKLGVGPGGFYNPGYTDGAKLRLQMMCLGKNWDPQMKSYGDIRPFDGAQVPQVPVHFKNLVEEAIQTAHSWIKRSLGECHSVDEELPKMSPDLCIVNFYSKGGRLGLHQDKNESPGSLRRRLPVVSFCLGDAADFLYGESRDADKAENVKLENGDVLIFGGKSRHIFHGVARIHPGTAPEWLVQETNLRPGRLNLTFRQF